MWFVLSLCWKAIILMQKMDIANTHDGEKKKCKALFNWTRAISPSEFPLYYQFSLQTMSELSGGVGGPFCLWLSGWFRPFELSARQRLGRGEGWKWPMPGTTRGDVCYTLLLHSLQKKIKNQRCRRTLSFLSLFCLITSESGDLQGNSKNGGIVKLSYHLRLYWNRKGGWQGTGWGAAWVMKGFYIEVSPFAWSIMDRCHVDRE